MVRKRKSQPHLPEENVVPLKALREELNMTQAEFAVTIGIDPSTVSRCERGIAEPTFTVLQMKKLCKLTGKDVLEFPDHLGKS